MIGLVTDSNSQIPADLARRYDVEVVPLTVTVDGVAYAEGEDLDADAFWAFFGSGTPEVTTSQPSPGRFAQAYAAVAGRGADEILSVHIGSALSGTVNAARVAAETAPVPVRVVDTATASFGVACCVWEAAEAVAAGATAAEAAAVARAVGAASGLVYVVEALDLPRAGGRLAQGPSGPPSGGQGPSGPPSGGQGPSGPPSGGQGPATAGGSGAGSIPVLTLTDGAMAVVGHVAGLDEAAEVMAAHVCHAGSAESPSPRSEGRSGPGLRVGVGQADAATAALARALEDRLARAPEVLDVVRYRVGPSVGAHTGPGTVGAVYYRVPGASPSSG